MNVKLIAVCLLLFVIVLGITSYFFGENGFYTAMGITACIIIAAVCVLNFAFPKEGPIYPEGFEEE